MTLPIYQYFDFKYDDNKKEMLERLQIFLDDLPWYKAPIVIQVELSEGKRLNDILNFVKNYCFDNQINTKLPYSIYYILNDKYEPHRNIFSKKDQLPRYFRVSKKVPGNMENEVLGKITILQDKISALLKKDGLQKLNLPLIRHKRLYELTKEAAFLESLGEDLSE